MNTNTIPTILTIIRHGTFRFYLFPKVKLGMYKFEYDYFWYAGINTGLFSLEWEY